MAVIVQKFGGTSVAEAGSREHVIKKIRRELDAGNSPVVVVSAMGRRPAPYATDTLLDLVPGAAPDLSALVVSCGEIISACIVANSLCAEGIPAKALTAYTAGIMASGPYEAAHPETIQTAALETLIKSKIVPVVTGFQGVLSDSSIATLGRGGSDTTAVALGAWLHAAYVDIFTDVPGVAMTDPRIVPEAPFIPYLDYESMVRLSSHGSRVLHDLSAKIALEKNVCVRIRSTFDDSPGTVIGPARGGEMVHGNELSHYGEMVHGNELSHYGETTDLAGIAVKDKDAGSSLVTVVYKTGMGKGKAEKIVEQLKVKRNPCDDPDAVVFDCPKARVKETLQAILAPYIN